VEAELDRLSTWRYKVRASEARKEVIQRYFVGHVDHCEAQAPTVSVAVKQVIFSHRDVEKVSRLDPIRIVVIVLLTRDSIETALRQVDQFRCDRSSRTVCGCQRVGDCCDTPLQARPMVTC
jgi:hypothetical protein